MAEIENLSISISANAAEAIAEINKLASALGKFSGASNSAGNSAGRTADKVQDLGTATAQEAEETGEAAAATKTFGDMLRAAGINVDAVKGKFGKLTGGIKSFFGMITRVAKYRAIRAALRMITDGFKEGIKNFYDYSKSVDGNFAKSMDNLATSAQYLKNSLGTLAAPLMEALSPVLEGFIDQLVTVINYINQFVAIISGRSSYTAAVRVATTWSNAANSASTSIRKATDDMKRTILGFDEINKLAKESSGGGGGGGYGGVTGGGGGSYAYEEVPLQPWAFELGSAFESAMQDTMSRITLIIGGAELALGAILALTGANVPLGLGLIAAGAVGIGDALLANWDTVSDEVKIVVGAIEAVLSGGLAVGAILAFSSANIPLGIGLMAGALATGSGAVSVSWSALGDKVKDEIGVIAGYVAAGMLGIGVVLLLTGHPGLGIGAIIASGGIAAVAVQWSGVSQTFKTYLDEYGRYVAGALFGLGALLLIAGQPALGIGAIIASGAITVATVEWSGLKQTFSTWIKQYGDVAMGALFGLGVLLLLIGHPGLGIGAIIASAAINQASTQWSGIKTTFATYIEQYGAIVMGALLAIGTILILTGHPGMGIGAIISSGVITASPYNWSNVYQTFTTWIKTYGSAAEKGFAAIGIMLLMTGHPGLGIGAIIASATFHEATYSWSDTKRTFTEQLKSYITTIQTYALVIGAILLLTNHVALGLGILAADALTWLNSSDDPVGDLWSTIETKLAEIGGRIAIWWHNFWSDLWDDIVSGMPAWMKKLLGIPAETTTGGGDDQYSLPLIDPGEVVIPVSTELEPGSVSGLSSAVLTGWAGLAVKNRTVQLKTQIATGVGIVAQDFINKWGNLSEGKKTLGFTGKVTSTGSEVATDFFNTTWGNYTGKHKVLGFAAKITSTAAKVAKTFNKDVWGAYSGANKVLQFKGEIGSKAKKVASGFKTLWKQEPEDNKTVSFWTKLKKGWTGTPQSAVGLTGLTSTVTVNIAAATDAIQAAIEEIKKKIREFIQSTGWFGRNSTTYSANIAQFSANTADMNGAILAARNVAMPGIAIDTTYSGSVNGASGEDMGMLAEMVRMGVEQAMARQNELDRQRNEYLRQINEKEFSADVSTSAINRANSRMNRRAGITVAPVGAV